MSWLKISVGRRSVRRPPFHRVIMALSAAVLLLAVWILLVFIWPNRYEPRKQARAHKASALERQWAEIMAMQESAGDKPGLQARAGLFKPATPLRDKPVADKTVERIKSKLKLQCVMEMNHQPVAYIHIDGTGLKQCHVGQTIHDLFTVLNIHNDRVDLSIVDHNVTLRM